MPLSLEQRDIYLRIENDTTPTPSQGCPRLVGKTQSLHQSLQFDGKDMAQLEKQGSPSLMGQRQETTHASQEPQPDRGDIALPQMCSYTDGGDSSAQDPPV